MALVGRGREGQSGVVVGVLGGFPGFVTDTGTSLDRPAKERNSMSNLSWSWRVSAGKARSGFAGSWVTV